MRATKLRGSSVVVAVSCPTPSLATEGPSLRQNPITGGSVGILHPGAVGLSGSPCNPAIPSVRRAPPFARPLDAQFSSLTPGRTPILHMKLLSDVMEQRMCACAKRRNPLKDLKK